MCENIKIKQNANEIRNDEIKGIKRMTESETFLNTVMEM